MSIVSVISEIEDSRKGSNIAKFNGYLEDYLSILENEELKSSLQPIVEAFPEIKVLVEYRFSVNRRTISNQIIRYKDVFKLPNNYFDVALILYGEIYSRDVAIMVADGSRPIDYFLAKGMYYTLTEQYGTFEKVRNDLLCLTMGHISEILEVLHSFENRRVRFGSVQRRFDRMYFNGFYELKDQLLEIAQGLKDNIEQDVQTVPERSIVINRNIATWFLFKKLVYVQFMSNRDLLRTESDGNIKEHRTKAKQFADEIPFVPLSAMWRLER